MNYTMAIDLIRKVTTGILLSNIKTEKDIRDFTKAYITDLDEHKIQVLYDLCNKPLEYIRFANFVSSVLKQKDCFTHSDFNKNLYEAISLYDKKEEVFFNALEINDLFYDLANDGEIEEIEEIECDGPIGGACGINEPCGTNSKNSYLKKQTKYSRNSCSSRSNC